VNLAWLEPWKSRWSALGQRERRAVSALAVFLGAVLFFLLIWLPVERGLARSQARLASIQGQLAQVREQAALVESLRKAPRVDTPADAASTVQEAAVRNGLREQVKRVDDDGARNVRVQIEAAPFSSLMSLLVDLQQSGLRAENATFERNAKPGTVDARLLLQARGA
jgi:type II secretory pathway component PulM